MKVNGAALTKLATEFASHDRPRTTLDRARDALNARMTKDNLLLVLENVINYAAELEAEREKLVRWHSEDGKTINRLVARVERRQAQLVALRNERDQAKAAVQRGLDALRVWRDERKTGPETARLLYEVGAALTDDQPAGDDDLNDNRRCIYIDGKGNGWISVCSDEGTEWVVPVQPEAAVEQDVRDVADETGSLREIGRCW